MTLKFDIERLIHSLKTAVACFIGFGVVRLANVSTGGQWILITIIVVMCSQMYVGSVIQKAYLRFLGTLVGCLFAAFALEIFGASDLTAALTISLSAFIFSYLSTSTENLSYAGTLGGATTAIIMLGHPPTLPYAAERFLEISIGILIAALISQFLLPIHARSHLRRAQAKTLEQLREYYTACMITHAKNIETMPYQEFDETIVKLLSRQRQLAKEAKREPLGIDYNPERFMQTLQCEKEILRIIDFMFHALRRLRKSTDATFLELPALQNFHQGMIQSLTALIKAVETDTHENLHLPPLLALKEKLKESVSSSASREELISIDGFLFSAETLSNNLIRLANLYQLTIFETPSSSASHEPD